MNIVFMGTPDFAVESLKILFENNYNIVAVVTAPDKPAGRGQKLSQSAVKEYAIKNNLKVLQPEKLKNPLFIEELQNLKADLQIVVAFRMLPEIIWKMPTYGTFNLHASLLPDYRGAAPLNWAVINGETETGVTTFFIEQEIDTGNLLFQEKVSISENETAGELHDKLMLIGSKLVLKTVQSIENKNYTKTPQSALINKGVELKSAPKIFKEHCRINWNQDVYNVHNLIRGLSPYPTAWTEIKSTTTGEVISMKIYLSEAIAENHQLEIGTLVTDNKTFIKVAVQNGFVSIRSLQLAGKKQLKVDEFLRGFAKIHEWKIEN